MIGADGSDTYLVDSALDVVVEANASPATGGTDVVYSYLANYTLPGNVENLRLLATGAANGTGNALNNVLYAGAGNNVLNGAAGVDTVSYLYAGAGVTASLAIGTAQATGGSGSDTFVGIENLSGSNYADTLEGNTSANVLAGGGAAPLHHQQRGGDGTVSDFVSGSDKIRVSQGARRWR